MSFLTSTQSLLFVESFSANMTEKGEQLELEIGKKWDQGGNSSMELLHHSRKDSADDEIKELTQTKFLDLLTLNLPDWYLVLLGVICEAIYGALFPFIAVLVSGVFEVGVYGYKKNLTNHPFYCSLMITSCVEMPSKFVFVSNNLMHLGRLSGR